uniref:Uncharacterized protein n=1 Tax=Rhizophora mucronata TaxID=61149 RepID=A0A2P2MYZ5_RHIMU
MEFSRLSRSITIFSILFDSTLFFSSVYVVPRLLVSVFFSRILRFFFVAFIG